ncbi:diacylglycerol acyltransferase [Gorgonomyces haynaldii]|nr:diacylglycerol acyltransferase [Gorgonomyces haynaldii]
MEFAPLHVPLPRRLQTLSVIVWIVLVPACVTLFLFCLMSRTLLPFMLAYIVFIYLDPSQEMGGRPIQWVKRLSLWKGLRDFFPMELVKTAELDPSKNYVFVYHPHGIISLGAWTNFATEANHFSSLFKGIFLRLVTLETNFNFPFSREILLSLGICSVSRRSLDNIITKGPGHSVMIVLGGAAESLYAFPGKNDVIIKRRLGFVKLALNTGSSLVPVYSFGENDLWNQIPNPKGSLVRTFQETFQKYASFAPPFFHGRGIFTYNAGLLPFRRRVVSVVGAPIPCPKTANPSYEMLVEYQQKYIDGLMKIWEDHHEKYAPDAVTPLTVIE